MKRRTVVAYVAGLMVVALAGCSSGSDSDDAAGGGSAAREAPEAASAEEMPPDSDQGSSDRSSNASTDEASGGVLARVADETFQREIIYTIDLEISTDDVDAAAQRAASVAQAAGGFVAGETTSNHRSTITLRIPVERHSNAVGELQKLGKVTHRDRSTEDVTQEVVDTESRITSQRESIARIRALLRDATDLSDVIGIEAELARREADLDSLLSQQKQLADLTALATVTATFYGEAAAPEEDEEATGFLAGLDNGWEAFKGTVGVVLTVLGALLPFLGVALLVGAPAWFWYRRRRPQPVVQAPASPPAV